MNIYSVVAVSNSVEFTGECVSFESLNAGDSSIVEHHDCNGNTVNTKAEIKEILSEDLM